MVSLQMILIECLYWDNSEHIYELWDFHICCEMFCEDTTGETVFSVTVKDDKPAVKHVASFSRIQWLEGICLLQKCFGLKCG
jgi:hypothetical protein